MRTAYEVLGVPRDASEEEIRAAFGRRLREVAIEELGVSPSASDQEVREALRRVQGQERGRLSERFDELRAAAETLLEPNRRAAHDATLDASPAAPAPGGWDSAPMLRRPQRLPRAERPSEGATATLRGEDERLEALVRDRAPARRSRNPIDRLTAGLPRGWRIAIDWAVTIVGAIAIVLAIKAWVVNPYRIPSSSMEPTLHCARPGSGCLARFSDRVLANRFIYHFRKPHRGEIIVFKTPPAAVQKCGAGGTFVKRLIGLPGETWEERSGSIYINGRKLVEPYVQPARRDTQTYPRRKIPRGYYFMMGDNRIQSCDSREWGPVPRKNLIGEVFAVYWPPNRIGFR